MFGIESLSPTTQALGLMALATPAAYLGGRYLAAPALSWALPSVFGRDEEEKADFGKRLGLIGALGTALPILPFAIPNSYVSAGRNPFEPAQKTLTPSENPSQGPAPSRSDESWKFDRGLATLFTNHPGAAVGGLAGALLGARIPSIKPKVYWGPVKKGSWFDPPVVPVNQSMSLVASDPVLSDHDKAELLFTLMASAGGQPAGLVTIPQLVGAAVNTGLGAAAGYGIGKVFSLPRRVQQTLAGVGGIGALLKTLGVIT